MAADTTAPRKKLTRYTVQELIQAALELYYTRRDGPDVRVVHDAKIRVPGVPGYRQLDVLIISTAGGREIWRMVEVQQRTQKIGQPFVDSMIGKISEIGAHRLTLVSTRGFTDGAIARIRTRADLFDAFELKQPAKATWPYVPPETVTFSDSSGATIERVQLAQQLVLDPVSGDAALLVLSGVSVSRQGVIVVICPRPTPGEPFTFVLYLLESPEAPEIGRITAEMNLADGSKDGAVITPGRVGRIESGVRLQSPRFITGRE